MAALCTALANAVVDAWEPDMKSRRRYLGGLKASKYFEEVAWPENAELFTLLGFNEETGLKCFESFIEIDNDNSGEVSLVEFHTWLGFKVTKFSERVFGLLDMDGSGFLDFREYVIGVWNFNTYDASLLAKLAYNIFDVDERGVLDMAECDALVRMVYNVGKADPMILQKMDVNGDGMVTLEELEQLVEVHNYILQPAFDVQRALRQRVVGVKYWESEMVRRRAYFSGYDAGAQSSWDSIRAILEIKHKERLEEEERQRELAEADQRRTVEADKARQLRMREEIAGRRRRRAAERAAATETEEQKAARSAAQRLATAEAALAEELVFADLPKRIAQRDEFWRAFDANVHAATKARVSLHAERLATAEGADAEARLEDDLATPDGARVLEGEVVAAYAWDLRKRLREQEEDEEAAARRPRRSRKETKRRRWGARSLVGPLIAERLFEEAADGESDGDPSLLARFLTRHVASAKQLTAAREEARTRLLSERRVIDAVAMVEKIEAEEAAATDAATQLRALKVGDHGGPASKWDRFWDAQHGRPYWMHWETRSSQWDRPDVCDVCDAAIEPDDALCFQCNSHRSDYNRARWALRQPTPPPQNSTAADDDGTAATGDDDDDNDDDDTRTAEGPPAGGGVEDDDDASSGVAPPPLRKAAPASFKHMFLTALKTAPTRAESIGSIGSLKSGMAKGLAKVKASVNKKTTHAAKVNSDG